MSARPLRILLVVQGAPVPLGGAAARWSYVLVRELLARGHDLTVFGTSDNPAEVAEAGRLFGAADVRLYPPDPPARGAARLAAKAGSFLRPYSYLFSRNLRRELAAEMRKPYDVLHCEQLWTAWAGRIDPSRSLANVLNHYRVDLALYPARGMGRLKTWAAGRAERRLTRRFRYFLALSPELAGSIAADRPGARVRVVPLGIDASQYELRAAPPPGPPVVGLIGSMNWPPTLSAAARLLERLWPRIAAARPDARLVLVGWGAKAALARYPTPPSVEIYENVSDARPYFARLHAMVYAPLGGSGMKVKVLEALGTGVPVVTNASGAEGLPLVDGDEAVLAESDDELVAKTLALLDSPEAQDRIRRRGRAFLERHCGPGPTVDAVEATYREITGYTPKGLQWPD